MLNDYLSYSYEELEALSNQPYILSDPVQLAYHLVLEAARHYVGLEREFFARIKTSNIYSQELRKTELRQLKAAYKKAVIASLNEQISEQSAYYVGLQCMRDHLDYSQVANETSLIKNTYDLIFWHGYNALLRKIAHKINSLKNDLYHASMIQTYHLWD